nr:hypothetical protein GCM10020092_052470 [Actinoplanes digitatis]
MDGTDVIRGLRGWTAIPIIVLSGRAGSHDKVDALDAGADDYVTKPFGIDELLARIRAVTRRAQPVGDTPPTVTIGEHTIDLGARSITGGEADVRLTPTEWQLLEHLLRHPGKLISQRALLRDVWGPRHLTESNYLRQYMARLRRKLEADPAHPPPPAHRTGHGIPLPALIEPGWSLGSRRLSGTSWRSGSPKSTNPVMTPLSPGGPERRSGHTPWRPPRPAQTRQTATSRPGTSSDSVCE